MSFRLLLMEVLLEWETLLSAKPKHLFYYYYAIDNILEKQINGKIY